MWSVWIHDLRTGAPLLEMFPSSGSWNRRLTGTGQGSHVFQLRARETALPRATVRDLFRNNDRAISVCFGDHVAYAGFVETPKYQRGTGTLAVTHREIREMFRQRSTFGVNNYPAGDLTVTNRSPSGAVRAILARAMQWTSQWAFPIDLPPDGSGSFSAEWKRYQRLSIDDLLCQVEAEGVEVDFDPYRDAAGNLRWRTRVGAPIVSGYYDLPVTVDESRVIDLDVEENGAKQLSGVHTAGNGTEEDMVTAFAWAMAGPPMVVRDAFRTSKDVRDPTQLGRISTADLAANRGPVVQWSFSVVVDDELSPAMVTPGTTERMDVRDDEWIDDGLYEQRVIALSGRHGSSIVNVEVQAHGG